MDIEYERDLDKMHYLWRRVVVWLDKHNVSCPEDIMQSDDPRIEAPQLLADIVEHIIKPEIKE